MNCNTTHYRANSSSVPGDPTLTQALALAPLAARAAYDWEDSLAPAWDAQYTRLFGRRQRACRWLTRLLRWPEGVCMALTVLAAWPALVTPLIGRLSRPLKGEEQPWPVV